MFYGDHGMFVGGPAHQMGLLAKNWTVDVRFRVMVVPFYVLLD